MFNAPLTPAPPARTVDDEVMILRMDRERRQKREDIKRSVPWTPAHQEQNSAPILDDEDCQGAKRQCVRDETKNTTPYGYMFCSLQPRNLNSSFEDCDSQGHNTGYYIRREPPVPISPC